MMDARERRYVELLQARRLIELVGVRAVPAVTAGFVAGAHSGSVGDGVLVLITMLAVSSLLARLPFPVTLTPARQVAASVGAPVIAGALLLGLAALGALNLTFTDLLAPVVIAFLITVLARWVQISFETSRPVRVAVVGSGELTASLARELELAGVDGYTLVGWLGEPDPVAEAAEPIRRLGSVDDLRSVVTERYIQLLVYVPERPSSPHPIHAGPNESLSTVELIAHDCVDLPVRMLDVNQFYEELLGHVPLGTIDAAWFRYIMHPRFRPGSPLSKRLVDLVLGSVAAVLALPVVAVAAVAVKLTSPGPVLYRQRRAGERGREFEILKLRTMRVDSEVNGPQWSSMTDDRVTSVGRVLRRAHIDELPQLWNVLRGEMTLVGPRPERPELVAWLERQFPYYERRHLVKPGITGWAQIRCGYAGSEMGSAWKLCHDLYYLKHRSMLADLMLMIETLPIVVRDTERALEEPAERFISSAPASGEQV